MQKLTYLDISGFSGYGETSDFMNGVPSSGKIRVGRRFDDTVQKYLPKKWQMELVE